MPALASLVENGVMGELAGLPVPCSPLLWTTLTTGQLPDKHGVLDAVEPDPRTGGVRPVTRASLRAVPVWDILAREGLRCQTIGWPATHPAEPPSTCVSDGFAYGIPLSISPAELESTLAPLRFNPQEWTGDALRLFVPELSRIDQDKDKRLARLAVSLAEAASVQAAATALLERDDWDFTAVRFSTLSRTAEIFPDDVEEIYRGVLSGVHRFLDLMLRTVLRLAGQDSVVILVSDRATNGGRGILCASGNGIQADELTFGANLLDVAPTVLGVFGYAPAPGMAGASIREICGDAPSRLVNPANCVSPPAIVIPPEIERDMRELAAMGYADRVASNMLADAERARKRREFHLARVLLATGRADEAIEPLEKLAAEDSAGIEVRLHLCHAYFCSGRIAECRRLCEALLSESPDSPLGPLARAHLAIAEGRYAEARVHLASGRDAYGLIAVLDAAIGNAYLQIGNWREAAEAFRFAIVADPAMAGGHQGLAQALLEQQLFEKSAEAALDAIRLHYDAPTPHKILGLCLRALGREEAASAEFEAAKRVSGPCAV
jgi:tetratricopeptide (TPR) repeat protein